MTNTSKSGLSRRTVLSYGAAGAAALALPNIVRAQGKSLKVGAYGGYFKDSFDKHIFPVFTKETGIEVESIAEPTGEAWLVQLQQAAQANVAPADVSMMAQVPRAERDGGRAVGAARSRQDAEHGERETGIRQQIRGRPGRRHRRGHLVHHARVQYEGLSARRPNSWAFLWDPSNADKLGLLALVIELLPARHHRQDLLWRTPRSSTPRTAS